MTVRSSLFFLYNGEKSTDYGIMNVNVSSGMLEEPFLATRQINEVKIRGKDRPIFSTITHDPLSFTLSFAFANGFDSDSLRAVSRWLSTEYYKPLVFSDNLDRVYYAMLVGDSKLTHDSISNGLVTVTMRCDGPYSFSPYIESPVYDLSSNPANGTIIQFKNTGDINVKPKAWIEKIGAGNITINNLSNGGQSFQFTGLADKETVFVDNENEIIISDQIPTVFRYSNFNNTFLDMTYGVNNLQILGNAIVRFKYQLIYLQG